MEPLIAYEYIDGSVIHPTLTGKVMPVPPPWVRQRAHVPQRSTYATLAREWAGNLHPEAEQVLTKYIRNWAIVSRDGTDLLIAGINSRQRRQWAGAAVMNEITMRYSLQLPLTTEFANAQLFSWMHDTRLASIETYMPIRNKLLNAKLLLIENPHEIRETAPSRWLLESVYAHRFENKLPTITTLSEDMQSEGAWKRVRKVLGNIITDVLRDNTHGYIAHV